MKRQRFRLLKDLYHESHENRLSGKAAEVTFFAVLSLFPALLMVASTLGYLQYLLGHDVAQRSQETVINFLTLVLTDKGSAVIQSVRDLFAQDRTGVATIASVVAFYTLSTGFAVLIRALDIVYGVVERRSWLHVRLTSFALSLGSIVMLVVILAAFVIGPRLGEGWEVAQRLGLGEKFTFFWDWIRTPAALALVVVWLTTLYHLAPYRRRGEGWLKELPGALLGSFLFYAISHGLGLYMTLITAGNDVLGLLGGGLILMIWFYLMTLALLFGGELNAVIARDRGQQKGST